MADSYATLSQYAASLAATGSGPPSPAALPGTRALHDLAPRHKLVAWTHDLTATNSDYALPNPTQPPWNLMRTSSPEVTYVATSKLRADELEVKYAAKPLAALGTQLDTWRPILWILIVLTTVIGASLAVVQRNVKRLTCGHCFALGQIREEFARGLCENIVVF